MKAIKLNLNATYVQSLKLKFITLKFKVYMHQALTG